ncbi:hypothetical protein GCM10020295_77780 [Streptomyces cinereospinus]
METAPLAIIGHCPAMPRRRTPTISWTSPAVTAQTPQTRRTAGMPEVAAAARPAAVRVLSAMFAQRPRTGPRFALADRTSTTAQATSNRG